MSELKFNKLSFITSDVEDMARMFWNCKAIKSLDLSNFDTAKVKSMASMFCANSSLTTIKWDTSKFITSNVESMAQMFDSCRKLSGLDLSNFDTSNVKDMSGMFVACHSLSNLDLSSFNTAKVEKMDTMFKDYKSTTIYVSVNFVTTNVASSANMFLWCNSLKGGNDTTLGIVKAIDPDNYLTATYAKIDKEGQMGYFTLKEEVVA